MSVTPLDRRRPSRRACPYCGLSPMMVSADGTDLTCPNRHKWLVDPEAHCHPCALFAAELVYGPLLPDATPRAQIRAMVEKYHQDGHTDRALGRAAPP
jgi:hypothetical protein